MSVKYPAIVKVTVPAGLAANSLITEANTSMVTDYLVGYVKETVVPVDETWVIDDIYVKDTPSIDVVLEFFVNDKPQFKTPAVSTMLVTNPARRTLTDYLGGAFGIPGGARIKWRAYNLAAGGASATDVYIHVDITGY